MKIRVQCGCKVDRLHSVHNWMPLFSPTGELRVVEPDHCVHISPATASARQEFQRFLRSSALPVYNRTTHEGVWRTLTIRTNREADLMVVVIAQTDELDAGVWAEEKRRLAAEFGSACAARGLNVVSLVCFSNSSASGTPETNGPLELVSGSEAITETLLGRQFRVSPAAFFQVSCITSYLLPGA